jgi:DnaJ-class molecular chaperone
MSPESDIPVSHRLLTCPDCKGTGIFHIDRSIHSMYDSEDVPCDKCAATGKIVEIKIYVLKTIQYPYER